MGLIKRVFVALTVFALMPLAVSAGGGRERIEGEITSVMPVSGGFAELAVVQPDGSEIIVELSYGTVIALGLSVGDTAKFVERRGEPADAGRLRVVTTSQNGQRVLNGTRIATENDRTTDRNRGADDDNESANAAARLGNNGNSGRGRGNGRKN